MLSYIEMDAQKNLALATYYRLYMDKVYFYTNRFQYKVVLLVKSISNFVFVFPQSEFSS
jgi:hypothetical protein